MKLALRDLKHNRWALEVDEKDTVGHVKELNAAARGLPADNLQKFIYSGRILKDTDLIGSFNFKEKDFIVCIASKSKQASSTAKQGQSLSSTRATSSEPAGGQTPTQHPLSRDNAAAVEGSSAAAKISNATAPENAGASRGADVSGDFNNPSAFAMGAHLESAVASIMELGYERPQVLAAMRMAYNNPDRAVEYLLSGVDLPTLEANSQPATQSVAPQQQLEAATESVSPNRSANRAPRSSPTPEPQVIQPGEDTTDVNLFEATVEHRPPDFQQLLGLSDEDLENHRNLMRQNPMHMFQFLQPLLMNNRQLAETIAHNLEDFIQFMHIDSDIMEGAEGERLLDLAEHGMEGEEDEEYEEVGDVLPIQISPEEEQAINRLEELGFDRALVIQAYFACEKNEEITANYLFEHGNEE